MIKRMMRVMYLQIIEIIFVALLILPYFSLHGREVPFQAYFTMMIVSSLVFVFFLEKMKDGGKLFYLILILPAILITGNALAFPLILNLLLGLFLFWRTISNHQEHDKENEGKWILATILLGIVELFIFSAIVAIIVKIMIGQIVFILLGNFLKRWLELETPFSEKKQFFIPFTIVMTIIGVSGFLITINMNGLRWVFFSILKMGVTVFTFLAKPFFDWAEKQNWADEMEKLALNEEDEFAEEALSEIEKIENDVIFDPMIFSILFILGLALLFLYIYKQKKTFVGPEKAEGGIGYTSETNFFKKENSFFRRGKSTPPADLIRKEMYSFEKFAQKFHHGRESFESFSEWMNRLGIKNFDYMNAIYEKVRYGEASYSEQEAIEFKNQLTMKKKELKERQKAK